MNREDFFREFPYGVLVVKDEVILHAVGYLNPATQEDADALAIELAEDEELGLTDLEDYVIVPVEGSEWEHYMELFTGNTE